MVYQMKALGISGSPRKNGNTEVLVHHALIPFTKAGWETREILLSEKQIGGCTGCESCVSTSICIIEDDMLQVYRDMISADVIIIGSPVYFRNVTSQLKALLLIDLSQSSQTPTYR